MAFFINYLCFNFSSKHCFTALSNIGLLSKHHLLSNVRYYVTSDANQMHFKRFVIVRKAVKLKDGDATTLYVSRNDAHRQDYMRSLNTICEELEKRKLEYRLVERSEYTPELVDWADVIVSAGGDGTFLWAASNVKGHDKPVIGYNTDPSRSAGYLCLPKQWSYRFGAVIDQLLSQNFRWTWRQRIRTVLIGRYSKTTVELCDPQLRVPNTQFETYPPQVMSALALNEVFIAELLAGRVSYYDITIDNAAPVRQKSSGIAVCTGTGSTSWFHSINRLSKHTVQTILQIEKQLENNDALLACSSIKDSRIAERVADTFNKTLCFDPKSSLMAYTVRDPIVNDVYNETLPYGYCKRINICSRMLDGLLVIDGARSYRFGEGATIQLEINSDDALKTIELDD